MHAPNSKSRAHLADLSPGSTRRFALALALSLAPLMSAHFSAKAAETAESDSRQASVQADEPERSLADAGMSAAQVTPEAAGGASGALPSHSGRSPQACRARPAAAFRGVHHRRKRKRPAAASGQRQAQRADPRGSSKGRPGSICRRRAGKAGRKPTHRRV